MNFLVWLLWIVLFSAPLAWSLYLQLVKGKEVSAKDLWSKVALLVGGIALLIIFGRIVSVYINVLWFKELGYTDRYWIVFWAKWKYFLLGFVFPLVFFLSNLFLTKRKEVIKVPGLIPTAIAVSVIAALFSGLVVASWWNEFLLYGDQTAFGVADPIFGKDMGFYVFSMPVLNFIFNSCFVTVLVAIIGVIAIYEAQFHFQKRRYDEGNDSYSRRRKQQTDAEETSSHSRAEVLRYIRFHELTQVSILGVILMAVIIAMTYISRWELLFSTRGAVFGAGYTDVHVQLPAYSFFIVAVAICAVFLAVSAIARSPKITKIGVWSGFGFCLLVWLIGVIIVPAVYQRIWVSPNELSKETEYIKHDIEFTRKAYGLTDANLKVVDFPVNMTLDRNLINANKETLNTVRLWDFRVLQSTYVQTQVFRSYYNFPDVDVVRYRIGDKLVQLMCSARELDKDRLAEQAKTWQNTHLVYTHGFGMVANPVNIFTQPEGLPEYWIKDIPPVTQYPELTIKQPRIYFGETTTDHVYVKTTQEEFDYPKGEHNATCSYDGTGGVTVGTGLRKLFFAWAFDGFRLLAMDELKSDSRIMYQRDITTRVTTLAPFLKYDADPYQVIVDGKIWYIWDAYTTNNFYPYSTRHEKGFNYIRNSVKVVIDAYSGKVDFYVFDAEDPIIKTYQKIYPAMFKSSSQMPQSLKEHVRYPEGLLKIQGNIYSLYHMGDPTVFYNKEDAWETAREYSGNNQVHTVLPYYVIMQIPGEQREEFVLIHPFTPLSNDPKNHPRNNMVAWLAGRCDGENYGKLLVYIFSKDTFVSGPQQIGIRINQDEVLSKEISLWNQQGSQVIMGNLLVLPLKEYRLLYVQPIYIQAAGGKMPELKRVVVALGDRLAYGASFEDALKKLLSGTPHSMLGAQTEVKGKAPKDLIKEAAGIYERYRELSGQGKFTEAGKEMEELGRVLNQLNSQK